MDIDELLDVAAGPAGSYLRASIPILHLLYIANFLWFFAAFVQFTFNPRGAFHGGTRDAYVQDGRIINSPLDKANPPASCHKVRGDAYHYDLFMYLGALNGAMAAFVLCAMFGQPQTLWESEETSVVLQQFCLAIWGTGHASQALVGWGRIWRSKRWRWGGLWGLGMITVVDTGLWLADWALAYHG